VQHAVLSLAHKHVSPVKKPDLGKSSSYGGFAGTLVSHHCGIGYTRCLWDFPRHEAGPSIDPCSSGGLDYSSGGLEAEVRVRRLVGIHRQWSLEVQQCNSKIY
jgi:hypothetical protein